MCMQVGRVMSTRPVRIASAALCICTCMYRTSHTQEYGGERLEPVLYCKHVRIGSTSTVSRLVLSLDALCRKVAAKLQTSCRNRKLKRSRKTWVLESCDSLFESGDSLTSPMHALLLSRRGCTTWRIELIKLIKLIKLTRGRRSSVSVCIAISHVLDLQDGQNGSAGFLPRMSVIQNTSGENSEIYIIRRTRT